MAADKNLKIVRTHRSSYFRFATRRGGEEKGRERSPRGESRRLMPTLSYSRTRVCFTAFGQIYRGLRMARFDYVRDGRFKPVAASVQGDGLMAFVGKLRDKQGLFERLSFERSPSKKIYCYCSPFGIRGWKNVDASFLDWTRRVFQRKFHSGCSGWRWVRRDKGEGGWRGKFRIKNLSFWEELYLFLIT